MLKQMLLLSCVACASAPSGNRVAVAPYAPSVPVAKQETSLPGWVQSGSGVMVRDGVRVFYGVGAASGIKNPSLLRTSADNRARAELGKLFEVFSASLMKDFMDSQGQQSVEQAVKTMASMGLTGSEIIDRAVGADGTLYALASLDMRRAETVVAEAKQKGIVRVQPVPEDMDAVFDGMMKGSPKKEHVEPHQEQGVVQAPESVPQKPVSEPVRKGGKPDWVDGEDARFPRRVYLCAVGLGAERSVAENSAMGGLSRIFSSKVEQISTDFVGAYQKTGAAPLDVQSTEILTRVTTQSVLTGVQVMEVWEQEGRVYAYACMHRAQSVASLKEAMAGQDALLTRLLESASREEGTAKVRTLSKAWNTLLERETHNAYVRILDPSGLGVACPYAPADVGYAFEQAVQALKIAVVAQGPFADDFRVAVGSGLTQKGYVLSEGSTEGLDVVLTVQIRVEDGGMGTGAAASMAFARAVVQMELKNARTGQVFASFQESRKEGHRSKEEAERRAVRLLGQKLVQQVSVKIDASLKTGG